MQSTPPPPASTTAQVAGPAPGFLGHTSQVGSMPASSSCATAATNVPSLNQSVSDDELISRACERISESIFHVKFEPKSKTLLREHIEKLMTKLPADMKDIWKKKMEEQLGTAEETTTGFVVGDNPSCLYILTCAHSFEACFNGSSPISMIALKKLFKISVRCDHEESSYNKRVPRVYVEAEVCKLDSRKDMLLLKVKKGFCTHNHGVLQLADSLPPGLGLVGMVSWPFDRRRTTVKGSMSHYLRGPLDTYDTNPHGYNFAASEVNITAEGGSSGAPLIDLASRVLGLLHGGPADCVNYFVSLGDIAATLTSWGIIKKAGSAGLGTGGGSGVGTGAGSSSSSMKRSAGAP